MTEINLIIVDKTQPDGYITVWNNGACSWSGDMSEYAPLAKLLAKDQLFEGWNRNRVITVDGAGNFDLRSISGY